MTREQKLHLAAVVNPDSALLELEARKHALEAQMESLPEDKNVDLVIGILFEDFVPLRMQIAEMPAHGIGGVAVKLRQLLATITELGCALGSTEWDKATLRTALEAVERLAGGGDPAGRGAPKGGMPAVGIGGVAGKLHELTATVTEVRYGIDSAKWAEATIRSALEAAERLAGGGSPAGDGAPKGGRLHDRPSLELR